MFETIRCLLMFLFDGVTPRTTVPAFQRSPDPNVFQSWTVASKRAKCSAGNVCQAVASFALGSPPRSDAGRRVAVNPWAWYAMLSVVLLLACAPRGLHAQESSFVAQTVPNSGTSLPPPVPPAPDTVFSNPGTPPAFYQVAAPEHGSSSSYPRRMPWGNGHILIADPAEFPRIKALDVHSPGSLWDNLRPNLFDVPVEDEWDFYNLVNTDRPDFTDATYSVGQGVTIIESGYTFRRNHSSDLHIDRRQLPETLVRVGLTDEFEIRLKWNGYVMTDITDVTTGLRTSSFGGDDLQLGFKYEILQQDDWRPMVTFVGGTTVPSGTRGISADQMQPFGNVVLGWGFRRWLYLKASTGVDFVKSNDITRVIAGSLQVGPVGLGAADNSSQWHQSVSLLYQATQRVGGFVEWFSFFSNNSSDNRASHYIDTGLYIYLTPNTQLDVRIGERLSDRVDSLFTGAGFSVRF